MATLSVRRGTEGPLHDPYGYEQWQFTSTTGRIVTMRIGGLSNWISFGEKGESHWTAKKGKEQSAPQDEVTEIWFRATGIRAEQLDRIYDRLHHRCRVCGCSKTYPQGGMPGETLNLCCRCHDIVSADCDFRSIV